MYNYIFSRLNPPRNKSRFQDSMGAPSVSLKWCLPVKLSSPIRWLIWTPFVCLKLFGLISYSAFWLNIILLVRRLSKKLFGFLLSSFGSKVTRMVFRRLIWQLMEVYFVITKRFTKATFPVFGQGDALFAEIMGAIHVMEHASFFR